MEKAQVKEWPDEDGVWTRVSDKDCLAFCHQGKVVNRHGEIVVRSLAEANPTVDRYFSCCNEWIKCEVIVPEVETLSEPPGMVLVRSEDDMVISWCALVDGIFYDTASTACWRLYEVTVIPHEKNDPELVKLIEQLKEE